MSKASATLATRDLALHDMHRLISECHEVLLTNPSCLYTLAVRGHACMKVRNWDQAVQDFSAILRCRPDDVHGRFSRGMALFKCGRVDDAHSDFSSVLALDPNHVMARYARAGCYNSEGECNQAIQEYMLALQYDEREIARGFRANKGRLGLHEHAEHLIRKTLGCSNRSRQVSSTRKSIDFVQERAATRPLVHKQRSFDVPPRVRVTLEKRRRHVKQVRVTLTEKTAALIEPVSQGKIEFAPPQDVQKADNNTNEMPEDCPERPAPEVSATRVVPKTIRKVTVVL